MEDKSFFVRGRLGAVLLIASAALANAGPIAVANFSFENPALGAPGISSPIPNWSGSGGVFRPIVGTHVNSIPNGTQVGYILGAGSMIQDLGVAVQPGHLYQLDVYVGTQINFTGASYTVSLLDGGATTIASTSGSRNTTDPFVLISVNGVGAGTGNLRVQLTSVSGQPLFDAVQVQDLSPTAPEPSTLALLATGLIAFGIRLRRRQG